MTRRFRLGWSLFHEFCEALEDDVEHAAGFACLDHVAVELVESLGVACHGFGEGGPGFDIAGDLVKDVFEDAGALLLPEDFEGAEDGEAGILECGELASELGDDLGGNAAEGEIEAALLLFFA